MNNNISKTNLEKDLAPAKRSFVRSIIKYRYLYIMLAPVILYFAIFCYAPMYGVIIAFKRYSPAIGIWNSPWAGWRYFYEFFSSATSWRIIRNTLLISTYGLIFSFPAPIILAIMLNELKHRLFKRTVQTITYMPHFISIVIICGIVLDFVASGGIINEVRNILGLHTINFMTEPKWFYPIYIISEIWQQAGWSSIIYLAALSAINPELYEAAYMDGASRFKQLLHITLPGILPTITILFILQVGRMMNVGFEKVMLLYNPSIYETSDVISTFVYRKGLIDLNYSYSTAVELFNSIINFVLLIFSNFISRRLTETSLW